MQHKTKDIMRGNRDSFLPHDLNNGFSDLSIGNGGSGVSNNVIPVVFNQLPRTDHCFHLITIDDFTSCESWYWITLGKHQYVAFDSRFDISVSILLWNIVKLFPFITYFL